MAYWVKVISIKPEKLEVIPGTHAVERESYLPRRLSFEHTQTCTNEHRGHIWIGSFILGLPYE